MPIRESDFTPTILSFAQWFFRTLDPKFTEQLFAGRSIEEAAEQLFSDIVLNVKGDSGAERELTPGDYGAVMDRISALHLRTRHGEHCVLDAATSGADR